MGQKFAQTRKISQAGVGMPTPFGQEATQPSRPSVRTNTLTAMKKILLVLGILVLGVSLTGCFQLPPHPPGTLQGSTPVAEEPDIPGGYTDIGNGVALRWQTNPNCESYHDYCVGIDVYAYKACEGGVYIEANTLTSNGVVTGFTNEMVGSLKVGQRASVVLGWIDDGATQAELTEVNCYPF